jgi:hypothetical protein
MDCIVNEPEPFCRPFFDKFADLWSRPNQRECFAAYVRGLLAQMERKNVEAISERVVGQPYQGLHHFLAGSPWDAAQVNRRRVEMLQADQRCHWLIDVIPYVPDNWLEGGKADPALRTKADLALELLDRARQWGLWFRAVVADSWYGSNTAFVKGLDERSLPYVLEVNGDRRVNVRLAGEIASNEHRLKEALSLLEPEDLRPVRLPGADGTERELFVAALTVKIRRLPGRRRVVVVTHCPADPGSDQDLRFLLTNAEQLRHDTVARLYGLRNWVEVFYREGKDDLEAGQYQVRHLESIIRHWQLVFVAYSLSVRLRRQGRLSRWCEKGGSP